MDDRQNVTGQFESPGGFVFGVQGWTWGEQRPTSITFFLNGTVRVCDQHGRPIRGTVQDNKPVHFEKSTHEQVIAALEAERVDWRKLRWAGWPQLPYDKLKEIVKDLPPTPLEDLRKIPDDALRKDAIRVRREVDKALEEEARSVVAEEDE